jgi:fermentation-respiration switch protein FrsA (DUF1100 family)
MLLKVVVAVLIAGGTLVAIVRRVEPRFAFFPTAGETTTPADFGVPFESATLSTADGERLRGWALAAARPRALVLYFHGNGGNLSIWTPILVGVQQHGYDVRAIDYRGYGASSGRPTERGLYRDVDAALEWTAGQARAGVPIVYWGRSLGTAMAAYAAARRRPDGLILEAGFPDARSLLRASPPLAFLGLFSSYRFPTAQFASTARCPVLVVHGDSDRVIPFTNGRALFEALPEPKQFLTVRGGDHNDARPADATIYWAAIDAFIAGLRAA